MEDEVLVRLTFAAMLEKGGYGVVPVGTAEEALKVLAAVSGIQAVVTDVNLSPDGIDGYALANRVCREWGIGVVVVSGHMAPHRDLPAGVHFLAKPVHEATLLSLVRSVSAASVQEPSKKPDSIPSYRAEASDRGGAPRFTPRQQAVLEQLVQGKSNRDIAAALELSENTVKVHLVAIFRAFGVSSRLEAMLAAGQHIAKMERA